MSERGAGAFGYAVGMTDLVRPIAVAPRAGFRIWLEYDDGAQGEVDLSHLAGKGVFKAWDDRAFFERVHIAPSRAIAWSDDVDLCADALYLRLTGLAIEDVYPGAAVQRLDA